MVDLTLRGQCEEAMRLLHAGKPEEATVVGRRVLEAFPKHARTYAILGQTYLQMGKHEEAANLFRRVLGVDPEHTLAYASLGIIYEERGLYEEALWQLLRAFELSPGNAEIRHELATLYGAHTMTQPTRCKLTRGALARTYLRGQLYPKAIGELRELVSEEPHRYDLRVALAEALWHDRQYTDAEVVCQGILADLPNCLKANLILGQIWLNSQRDEEARALLQCAQELDPENKMAQTLFGPQSPLPLRTVRLPLTDADVPPVDLPYLEEDVAEGAVVEAAANLSAVPAIQAPTPAQAKLATPQETLPPEGLSLWDVEYTYVSEHPADYAARLDLARKLYSVGAVRRALEQYAQLVQGDYEVLPAVVRDLNLLVHLYPDSPEPKELLAVARERARQEPSS